MGDRVLDGVSGSHEGSCGGLGGGAGCRSCSGRWHDCGLLIVPLLVDDDSGI